MAGTAVLVIYPIIQFYGFIPVIDIGIRIKTVISGCLGRKFLISFGSGAFHVELAMQFRLGNIVEVVVRTEGIVCIIVCSQLGCTVG